MGCGDSDGGYSLTVNAQIEDLQNALNEQNALIESLKATLESQNQTINTLQGTVSDNTADIATKAGRNAFLSVKEQVDTIETYMIIDPAENTVTFEGVNVHIVSGSGSTDDDGSLTGLGNLQIGYNASPTGVTGSHNLNIGNNIAKSYGALLVGDALASSQPHNVVFGWDNQAGTISRGKYATVLGGSENVAYYEYSTVLGGRDNRTSIAFHLVP